MAATAAAVQAVVVVVADQSSAWTIRPALPGEAAALTEMALRSKASWGYDAAFMASCRDEMTLTASAISAATSWIVVALDEEKILGYFDLVPDADAACVLEAMFVDPQYMGCLLYTSPSPRD